jgi:hypothetical protein
LLLLLLRGILSRRIEALLLAEFSSLLAPNAILGLSACGVPMKTSLAGKPNRRRRMRKTLE